MCIAKDVPKVGVRPTEPGVALVTTAKDHVRREVVAIMDLVSFDLRCHLLLEFLAFWQTVSPNQNFTP